MTDTIKKDIEIIVKPRDWASLEWEMMRGAKDYKRERPIPPMPSEEDVQQMTMTFAYWIGYMLARAKVLMKRIQVERDLEPDPTEPRPKKAA